MPSECIYISYVENGVLKEAQFNTFESSQHSMSSEFFNENYKMEARTTIVDLDFPLPVLVVDSIWGSKGRTTQYRKYTDYGVWMRTIHKALNINTDWGQYTDYSREERLHDCGIGEKEDGFLHQV